MRKCRAHNSSKDDVDWVVPAVSDLAGGDDGSDANRRSLLDLCCQCPTLRHALAAMLTTLLVDSADCLGGRHPEWR
jgi:hypothetical protein